MRTGYSKNEEIYNVFNTEKILKRPVTLALTDKSGLAGIALWVAKNIGDGEAPPADEGRSGLEAESTTG